MLAASGAPPERIVSGLTATSLISTAVLFSLPVLSLPAILFGGLSVATTLLRALTYGMVVFALILGAGAVALFTDRPLKAVGTLVQRVRNRLAAPPQADHQPAAAPDRRSATSSEHARAALVGGAALRRRQLAARLQRAAGGAGRRRRAAAGSLVLLAYVVAALLGMVPITPGGLGFVEVGLVATLGLAGVGSPRRPWPLWPTVSSRSGLPIPAGGVAYLLYRRRYGASAEPISSE